MIKHTPGPWNGPIKVTPEKDSKFCICYVFRDGPEEEREDAEARANYRLIQAAPDLLEALQALLKAHNNFVFGCSVADCEGDTKAPRKAELAIMKAISN